MKTILLILLLNIFFINAFSFDLSVVKPFESNEDEISVCWGDTLTVFLDSTLFKDYTSIVSYIVCNEEPDFVGWSNASIWENYVTDELDNQFYFSYVVTKEFYVACRIYNLGDYFTNIIHVTPKGIKPSIVYSDTTFCSGSSMILSVSPDTLKEDSYKWYKNNIEIENELYNELEIYNSGLYQVASIDTAGGCGDNYIVSDAVQFYLEQPIVTGELKSYLNRITLSTEDLYTSYQWYEGTERNNLIQQVSSTTATSYSVTLTENDMYYSLSVKTQSGCNAVSDTFLINNFNYGVPVITAPEILDICPEANIILHTDDFYGAYQWYRDGKALTDATNDTLIITDKYPYGGGKYTVKVTTELDVTSTFESDTVNINLVENPLIYNLNDAAYCFNSEITFYSYNIYDNYQWYINDELNYETAVEVGNGDTAYSFNVLEDTVYYLLRTSHKSCSSYLYSSGVKVAPYQYTSRVLIDTYDDELNQKVCYGDSVRLNAIAYDAEPQWYYNGNLIDSLTEKEIYVKEYGSYTLSVTSTKCPELAPIISGDTVIIESRVNVNISVVPGDESYYVDNDPNHLIFCKGDTIKLSVDNPDNYVAWQWMGKLFSETSTSDEWEDMEGENDSIYSFLNGYVPKIRFKVRVDSVMDDGTNCIGISSLKVIDGWIWSAPDFIIADQNTNQLCSDGDSILLKLMYPGLWGKYEWRLNGNVLPNSDFDQYYAKDSGYYQIGTYFEKCMNNPPTLSGAIELELFDEALIYVEDEKIIAAPHNFTANIQWYYSSENPTIGEDIILENMIPVDPDTLLRTYEIPFDQAAIGYYVVTVENADNCMNISDLYFHNSNSIESNKLSNVHIYPNPVGDILNIELTNSKIVNSIQIFSVSGKLLYNTSNMSPKFSIAMSDFENGIYFIKIDYGDLGSKVKKIVVE